MIKELKSEDVKRYNWNLLWVKMIRFLVDTYAHILFIQLYIFFANYRKSLNPKAKKLNKLMLAFILTVFILSYIHVLAAIIQIILIVFLKTYPLSIY